MPFRFGSVASRSTNYRADIDGLRAVAVVSVLLFHLNATALPGGFVGVDIFFVISGYLITSIIVRDLEVGRFSFAEFYERRMRRILPPLMTVLLASSIAATLLLAPNDLYLFGRSLMATAGFVSNIWFSVHGNSDGYFVPPSATRILLHTWSLSVEEQFYLFFPVMLWAGHKFATRYKAAMISVLFAASFLLSIHDVAVRPTIAFYMLHDRIWELLLGALPVLIALPTLRSRIWREVASIAGLGTIVYADFLFRGDMRFPGPNALLPCSGALLLIYSGDGGPTIVGKLLSFRPIVFLGVMSYSIYLWHWPLIAFFLHIQLRGQLFVSEQCCIAVAAVLLAFLSFEFIEAPFREKRVCFDRRSLYVAGIGISVCAAILGLLFVKSSGLRRRFPPSIRATVVLNDERRGERPKIPDCLNFKRPVHRLADMSFCEAEPSAKNIMVWGDSHVEQLYPMLSQLEQEHAFQGQGLISSIAPGCPPSDHLNNAEGTFFCDATARFSLERAEKDDITTVYLQFLPWWTLRWHDICVADDGRCTGTVDRDTVIRIATDDLLHAVLQLKARGKRVILGLPFPNYAKSIPDLLLRSEMDVTSKMWSTPQELDLSRFRQREEQIARQAGVEIFDPRLTLCPQERCIYERDGVSLYRDNGHLASSQVWIMKDSLVRALNGDAPLR